MQTSNGRIFVSGGTNVFEVMLTEENALTGVERSTTNCNFTGLAQLKQTLYAACGDGGLYALALNQKDASLERIYELDGMNLPNGMIDGPDECLYIVDGPVSLAIPDGKIVRVCPDSGDPMRISTQDTWIELAPDLPNGITRIGQNFYYTDSSILNAASRVRRIYMDDTGAPSAPATLYEEVTVFDGLSAAGNTLLVTDFTGGRVFQIDLTGQLLQQTESGQFISPSSVLAVSPPIFRDTDVLVTEKGILGDTSSSIGNALWLLYKLPETVSD